MRRSLLLVLAFVTLPTMAVAQPRRNVAFHQIARAVVHRYAPIAYPDGSYRFPYGEAIPNIRVGVGDECDIELQPGEKINQAIISDSARWKATDGVSGADTPHMFVKPTEGGLWATLTVTTTRRVYHLRLESANGRQNEYVGFYYPQDAAARAAAERRRAIERARLSSLATAQRRGGASASGDRGDVHVHKPGREVQGLRRERVSPRLCLQRRSAHVR